MRFPCVLLLFLLLSLSAEARKFDRILKNVGRRFSDFNQIRIDQVDKNRRWQMEKRKFLKMTDAEVEADKMETIERVGSLLVFQQSEENPVYDVYSSMLFHIVNKSMTASICGGNELRYYPFFRHLRIQRRSWKLTKDRNVTFTVLPTSRGILEGAVTFTQMSSWGYPSTIVYKMKGGLVYFNPNTHYLVNRIEMVGGCSEAGTVDLTAMGVSLTEQQVWEKESDVQQLLQLFTPGALRYGIQPEDAVPSMWLWGLGSGSSLKATTCQKDGTEGPNYTNEQFKNWWSKFKQAWHPKKDEMKFMTTQLIRSVPNEELTARITMNLQYGEDESAPVIEWNMKIQAQFNLQGDDRWYINRVDVMCPIGIDIWSAAYDGMLENVQQNFKKMIADSMQWFSAVEVINKYARPGPIEMASCDKKVNDVEEVEKTFWNGYTAHPGTMKSFTMLRDNKGISADMRMFTIQVDLHASPGMRFTYVADWKFYLKWDPMYHYFYIYKANFGCARVSEQPIPCIHKICSYVDAFDH